MSSLAAARADNFYYGPDYRREHGSLNKFRGSHPLGDRAKKIGQGILIIRFEMPYKVFCTKCNEVIAQGVRFNAEKKCVGNYFTTKIFEFSMKCCFCTNIFRIETDPKNCEYKITAGLHKKVETFSCDDAQTVEFRSIEERDKLEKDPMLKLETVTSDRAKASTINSQLEDLLDLQESRSAADQYYETNGKMRKRFRERKVEERKAEIEEKRPKNVAIPLLSRAATDTLECQKVHFLANPLRLARQVKEAALESTSIFAKPPSPISCHSSLQSSKSSTVLSSEQPTSPIRIRDHAHPGLSLIIRPPTKRFNVKKTEPPQKRRLRLKGQYERLKMERRNAAVV